MVPRGGGGGLWVRCMRGCCQGGCMFSAGGICRLASAARNDDGGAFHSHG